MNRLIGLAGMAIAQAVIMGEVYGQVLSEAQVLRKAMGVEQYGVRAEEHYIFCNTGGCQERTKKHIRVSEVEEVVSKPSPRPAAVSELPKVETSRPTTPLFKVEEKPALACEPEAKPKAVVKSKKKIKKIKKITKPVVKDCK